MRTEDITNTSDFTNLSLSYSFSLDMWHSATFGVAMRFLQEFPWGSLKTLREKVRGVTFQMLLRGTNAVVYTKYPDNVVHKFFKRLINLV